MRASEQYVDDLRSMKPNVYMGGEIVRRDDLPILPDVSVRKKILKRLAGTEDRESWGQAR